MRKDEDRAPSQVTIENTVAIAELVTISKRTTLDMDRMIKHIEKILPIHEKISNLKKLLYSSIIVVAGFGTWIALEHFELKLKYETFEAVQEEQHKELNTKVNNNLNQITYLKGRIK